MSKSKPTTTATTTDTSSIIPDWLTSASAQAVNQAQWIDQQPYSPYTGQIVANQTPDTTQAYQQVEQQQGSANPAFQASAQAYGGLLGQAAPQTAGQINDLSNQLYGNYAGNVVAPAAGLLSGYLGSASPATAQQVGSNAQQLMSPYAASVIAPALQAGQQQLALANQGIAGQANNVGAFGGTRQGVQQGVAEAQTALGTQQNIASMLNTGWNSALTPATSLATNASSQGYNAASGLAGMLGTGYQNAQAAGQGLANTNLASGLTAASQLPTQATNQANLNLTQTGALQAAGTAQQAQQQQLLNAQLGQYYAQQDYPSQQLDALLSAVGGVPYSTTGQGLANQTATATKNVGAGVLGGALSGAATGAALGTAVPGIGNVVGAVGGGLLGGLLGSQ